MLTVGIIICSVTVIDAAGSESPGVTVRTKDEIVAFFASHPTDVDEVATYSTAPSLSEPYAPGHLSAASEQSALNMLNLMRYIAGLDSDVKISAVKREYAEAAALVNYLNNSMSHYPERPKALSDPKYDGLYQMGCEGAAKSNIAYGYSTGKIKLKLNDMIPHGWMADEDEYNIDRVGHRRWFLNPFLKTTGFGACSDQKTIHSAVFVQGEPGSSEWSESFYNDWEGMTVPWPAQLMPTEYFGASYPWSLSVGVFPDEGSVSVTLVRKSDGKTWNFSEKSADGDFYTGYALAGYGSPSCVIWRPDGLTKISDGEKFDVTVTMKLSGETETVAYTVEFFSLEAYMSTDPPVTEPPVTEPPATEPPVTEPPVTEPPVTEPPVTEPPVTEPPATEPPVTEPPVTEPPVTEPPVTEPPVTEPPVTEPPETNPPETNPSGTDDHGTTSPDATNHVPTSSPDTEDAPKTDRPANGSSGSHSDNDPGGSQNTAAIAVTVVAVLAAVAAVVTVVVIKIRSRLS